MEDLINAMWHKSSYSGGNNNCIEVAVTERVGIRDTKDRSAGYLVTTPGAWLAFINKVGDR